MIHCAYLVLSIKYGFNLVRSISTFLQDAIWILQKWTEADHPEVGKRRGGNCVDAECSRLGGFDSWHEKHIYCLDNGVCHARTERETVWRQYCFFTPECRKL
jgi:hypothetical protein